MADSHDDNPHRCPDPGYLGSTSFSATFFENKKYSFTPETKEGAVSDNEIRRADWLLHAQRSGSVKRGAECLAWIERLMPFEALVDKGSQESTGTLLYPWIRPCIDSIKAHIYQPLTQKEKSEKNRFLLQCSEAIFIESWQSFEPPGSRREDFMAAFTRSRIRWETIGIFLTHFALSSFYYKYPGTQLPGIERPNLGPGLERRLMEMSYTCLSFCEEAGHLTDLEIWLQCETFYLCSLIEGDAGHVTWRRLGDLISCIVAKGLHSEITVSPTVPFWLSEMRKKTFATAYGQDKTIAALVGRPPRLSRKYCHMQLPLDLNSDDLFLPPDLLEERASSLDESGWSQNGSSCSKYRACLLSHLHKEDILDLALTTIPVDDAAKLRDLQQRLSYAWNSQPEFIKAPRHNPCDPVNYMHMDFLYNQFLLQRVIVRKLGKSVENTDQLFRTSRTLLGEMLKQAPALHMNNSGMKNLQMGKFAADLPWLLMQYCLPPAGILGLELLRRLEVNTNRSGEDPSPMCSPSASAFNTSEAVQQLSVLASTLGWAVNRDHGNFEHINQARRVVLRILEQALSPVPKPRQDLKPLCTKDPSGLWWGDHSAPVMGEVDFWNSLPEHPLLR